MNTEERAVYLTFDDGPIPEVTPWVLDVLDRYGIKATFFMVGDNVRKHPEVYEEVVRNVKLFARDGSVIVFHDSLKSWPRLQEALPKALEWLIAQGYEFRLL